MIFTEYDVTIEPTAAIGYSRRSPLSHHLTCTCHVTDSRSQWMFSNVLTYKIAVTQPRPHQTPALSTPRLVTCLQSPVLCIQWANYISTRDHTAACPLTPFQKSAHTTPAAPALPSLLRPNCHYFLAQCQGFDKNTFPVFLNLLTGSRSLARPSPCTRCLEQQLFSSPQRLDVAVTTNLTNRAAEVAKVAASRGGHDHNSYCRDCL